MWSSVGNVPPVRPRRPTEFAELARSVKRAGLFERRRGYYSARIAVNLAVLAGVCALFVFIGDSWWQLFTAVLFAITFTQLTFVGHDAGHRQICRGKRANDVIGYAHGGLVGMSYGWWVGKHNRHHANPNHEDDDPDINIAMFAFTTGQSTMKRGFLRWMAKYQAILFFPVLLLEGLNLHWTSVRAVWRGEVASRKLEAGLLIAHLGGYLALVFLVLSPLTAVVFIAVHQGLLGLYMGCAFAPNHKGMPTLSADDSLDFLRKQVLTARNVRGGPWVDAALGGLNYQIEHHLFPTMPRPNLRRAQVMVQRFCAEHGIGYSECGLLRSYGHVLRYLHELGAPLRAKRL
ncbi:acyl-CoA desaturase [Haloechinothrix sp. YIM 98757]|uniref:Acyl-CoA desaturase n=1 Tax=Haloechinothrix aidingensis TaxID=2752311 RepID=A0A838ADM8_9PSEU|nr:acyl-CoA desaturase [Haloechinothrix aidingensis]MBA0127399.1 acyl-CoA desaturase [Haloechinothrix aidingensis]